MVVPELTKVPGRQMIEARVTRETLIRVIVIVMRMRIMMKKVEEAGNNADGGVDDDCEVCGH